MAARMTEPTTTRVGPSAMPRDANAVKRTPRSTAAAAVAWSCLVSRLEDAGLRKPPPLFASSPGRAQPVPLPLSATPPKQHGFSAGVASSPLQRSVRSLPLSWSSSSSRSLVLLARRQLCTSSLQMLAGRRLLSPAACLPVRRRPTAVDCSWHRDLDPPLIAVAKRCVQQKKKGHSVFCPRLDRASVPPSTVRGADQECLAARRDRRCHQLGIPGTGEGDGLLGDRCPRPGLHRRGQLAPSFRIFPRDGSTFFCVPTTWHFGSPGGKADSFVGPEVDQPFHEQAERARCFPFRKAQPRRRRSWKWRSLDWGCSEGGAARSAPKASEEAEDEGRWQGRGRQVLTRAGFAESSARAARDLRGWSLSSPAATREGWSPSLDSVVPLPSAKPAPGSRNLNPEVLLSSSPPGLSPCSAAPLIVEQSVLSYTRSPLRLSHPTPGEPRRNLEAQVLSSSSPVVVG